MLVTDGGGLPIGLVVESAQVAEIRLAERTVETIRVTRPRGRPKTRPARLTCDRAYDSGPFRRYLRRRGIASGIPARRRPSHYRPKRGRPIVADRAAYRSRWHVERTFAWLLSYRRIVVRWDRQVGVYRGFVLFALALICLNRLLQ
jgi:transposase